LDTGRGAFSRVLGAATKPAVDLATLSMLTRAAREQSVMLAALGDRENASRLVLELHQLPQQTRFVSAMRRQLERRETGLDWMTLLQ
jgi:hypothetical protein